ncbi:MAG: alpha/beta hydrolase [Candidatus Dadabacteria bacterium]|nr:MAG: alpha/beta hydrolase [Candidatus Dadabacteria bacterium]
MPDIAGPTSHCFFSQRLRLHYVDYGQQSKPLLVLIHGSRDHARSWDFVAARLRHRFHVIAPDLRGHGDSAWAIGSQYSMPDYVLDLAQLLRHVGETPATLVGHSLGGAIALHYAGIYPKAARAVVAIEGLGPPPGMTDERPVEERLDAWIRTMQELAMRRPRRYRSLAEAEQRMREANPHLKPELARHLTLHGTMRMEDGTYVWKFDNYVRAWPPHRYDRDAVARLWSRIECPVLLVRGSESWASNPVEDGRASHFRNYRYAEVPGAGHWVHHDRYEEFMELLTSFLAETHP